jgi:hypothetical protein
MIWEHFTVIDKQRVVASTGPWSRKAVNLFTAGKYI